MARRRGRRNRRPGLVIKDEEAFKKDAMARHQRRRGKARRALTSRVVEAVECGLSESGVHEVTLEFAADGMIERVFSECVSEEEAETFQRLNLPCCGNLVHTVREALAGRIDRYSLTEKHIPAILHRVLPKSLEMANQRRNKKHAGEKDDPDTRKARRLQLLQGRTDRLTGLKGTFNPVLSADGKRITGIRCHGNWAANRVDGREGLVIKRDQHILNDSLRDVIDDDKNCEVCKKKMSSPSSHAKSKRHRQRYFAYLVQTISILTGGETCEDPY